MWCLLEIQPQSNRNLTKMYMEQVYVNMNNVRQRLNVEFNNVDERRNNVVKMTISKKNNKNHVKLNATIPKF